MTRQDRLSRRRFLAGSVAAAGAISGSGPGVAGADRDPKARAGGFPSGFRWGTAMAAHQVEGGNVNSDAWLLEHMKPSTFAEPSGDACDFYHRYRDDVKLAAGLGFNAFRFSIEWARIELEPGFYSRAALHHYRRILACCHEHGLTPMVTYWHFTSPRWFAALGGWENPAAGDHFRPLLRARRRAPRGPDRRRLDLQRAEHPGVAPLGVQRHATGPDCADPGSAEARGQGDRCRALQPTSGPTA